MSNAGQGITAVVGGVIGFVAGGPAGAAYGFQIGLLLGTALFPTKLPGIEGPRLEDLSTTDAQVGGPIHYTYGTITVPGTVIWLGELVETAVVTTEEVGGKGGGGQTQTTTTYRYNQSIAVGLCEGPISRVLRIWENGELVLDRRPDQQLGLKPLGVRLDGVGFYQGNGLTGIPDSKTGTISAWFERGGLGEMTIYSLSGNRFLLEFDASNRIVISGVDSGGSETLRLVSSETIGVDGRWHHVAASWDLANGLAHMMIDGVQSTLFQETIIDAQIRLGDFAKAVGARHRASGSTPPPLQSHFFDGCVAEVLFHTKRIDVRQKQILRTMRNVDGQPADMGADGSVPFGEQPYEYMSGGRDTFGTNFGSADGYSITGSVSDCSVVVLDEVSEIYANDYTLYLGTEGQEPDPTIEAEMGAGNVPAFRGLAYLVYPDRELSAKQANRHPQWRFEIDATGVRPGSVGVIVGDICARAGLGVSTPQVDLTPPSSSPDITTGVDLDGAGDAYVNTSVSSIPDGKRGFFSAFFRRDKLGSQTIYNHFARVFVRIEESTHRLRIQGNNSGGSTVLLLVTESAHIVDFEWHHVAASWDLAAGIAHVMIDGVAATLATETLVNDSIRYATSFLVAGAQVQTIGPLVLTAHWNGCLGEIVLHDDYLDITTDANLRLVRNINGTPAPLGEDGSRVFGVQPRVYLSGAPSQFGDNFGSLGALTAQGAPAECPIPSAVSAGPEVSVLDLGGEFIHGYALTRVMPARQAMEPLRSVTFFDVVESVGGLSFPRRGKAAVATLTDDDLGAQEGGAQGAPPMITTRKIQDAELPRAVRLHYISPQRDYEPGEQISPHRLVTDAVNDVDVELTLAMADSQAARTAEVLWADAWRSRWVHEIVLDASWLALEPGDAVLAPVDARLERMRITEIDDAVPALRRLQLVRDDDGSYSASAVADDPQHVPQPLVGLSATDLHLLDLPALLDAHDDAGIYAAGVPDVLTRRWEGAVIARSSDAGATYADIGALTAIAVIGTLTSAPGAGIWTTWDDANEIEVTLLAGELESSPAASVLNGVNTAAVGAAGRWEIVQFRTAEDLGSGAWRVSGLLRGRRGTEHHIGTAQVGDTFVLLTGPGITRLGLAQSEIGAARTYRATTIGATPSASEEQTFTGAGTALLPFAPVKVAGAFVGEDLLIEWVRRGRLGQELRGGVDIPLSEVTEAYEIEILDSDTVVRTLSATSQSVTYTEAQQIEDWGSTPPESFDVRVYQLSALVGRGTPAEATV